MSNFKESAYQNPFSLNDPREKSRNTSYQSKLHVSLIKFIDPQETKYDNFGNTQTSKNNEKTPRFYENPFRDQQKNHNNDDDDFTSSRHDQFDSGNSDPMSKGISNDLKDGNKSSRSNLRNHEPENMRYYHLFNLKREPYRLRHYMYYSNDLNMDFHVDNYNKLGLKQGKAPHINYYMRYYDLKFENELDPKGKHYGSFYTLTNDNQGQNVVHNKEYKGYYSRQLDYVNFKLAMSQEKASLGK